MLKLDSYRAQQLGLVLKNFFPEQNKLAVLTRNFGRLDLLATGKLSSGTFSELAITKISYGMIIGFTIPNLITPKHSGLPNNFAGPVGEYNLMTELASGSKIKIAELELIYLPTVLPAQLLFWHQLLELIFYTVPVSLYIHGLFEQVCLVGANLNLFSHSGQKLLILCKVLSLLGIYPVDYQNFPPELRALIRQPIDISTYQKIDLGWESVLQQWWQSSMAAHPKVKFFKTCGLLL